MNNELSPLFDHLRAYKKSRVLAVALHRGVLACLEQGAKSVAELSAECGPKVGWLKPMIGVLAEFGLLQCMGEQLSLTDLGRSAIRDQALRSFSGYHFHCFSAWDRLPQCAYTGQGGNYHQNANADPDFSRAYLESLEAIADSHLDKLYACCSPILTGRVLDIGAGPATLTRKMAKLDPELTVSALDLEPLSLIARLLFKAGENFSWVAGDFWRWSPTEPFDSVYCSHLIEYCGVERIGACLERIGQMLADDGNAIFVTFLRVSDAGSDFDLFELSTGLNGETLGHVFSEEEITGHLKASGFRVIDLQYLPGGPSYQEAFIHCRRSTKGLEK